MSALGPIVAPAPLTAEQAKLKQVAHQLEGVFMSQLFRAMRDTVPQDEANGGQGGALFQSMLDDKFAGEAANKMTRGLGDALYRQLSRRLDAQRDAQRAESSGR